jgi:hypothetical protein
LKITPRREDKIKKLQSIVKQEYAIFWIERTLVYKLDPVGLSKEDVISVLKESASSSDFNTSHAAKEAIRRYEFIGVKR